MRLDKYSDEQIQAWLAESIIQFIFQNTMVQKESKTCLCAKNFQKLYELINRLQRKDYQYFSLECINETSPGNRLEMEWVSFLNWLGQNEYWVTSQSGSPFFIDQLIHHFCSDPNKWSGLIPIIARCAIDGGTCVLPRNVIDIVRNWGGRAKTYANILALARNDLTLDEIKYSAKELINDNCREYPFWEALQVASNTSLNQGALFSLALLDIISPESYIKDEIVQDTRNALSKYLTKLPSNLSGHGVWERLHLPEKL